MSWVELLLPRRSVVRVVSLVTVALAVQTFAVAGAAESFELRVVPAITDSYVLAGDPPHAEPDDSGLRLMATPGEYEPASFVLYAHQALADITITVSDFERAGGGVLDASAMDVRIVKRWYQTAFGEIADRKVRYMRPELLVYDDRLIKIEDDHNFLRLDTGEYRRVDKVQAAPKRGLFWPTKMPGGDAV
jgi:hypothetical protein